MKDFTQFLLEEKTKNTEFKTIFDSLENKKQILFLTTSNRWKPEEKPKTTQIAYFIKNNIKNKNLKIIETPSLNIHPCEGNISSKKGNGCGLKESLLEDKNKNPSGLHRCWCSLNNKDDELWKISKELFNSDCVIFFGSVRWGSMNSYYQKLIERLSWIENRHTTLGENNVVKNISAGLVIMGHNWNVDQVMETQKQVLNFYGFKVEENLCWSRQWTKDSNEESLKGYKDDNKEFKEII